MRLAGPWDDDDPAILRTRDAMDRVAERQAAPVRNLAPERPAPVVSKQARVSALIALVRAGDRAAADALRRLVSRLDNEIPEDGESDRAT